MSKGIYTSLSGALAQQRRVETISNNLANVNTAGYKRDDLTFREHLTALSDPDKDMPVPEREFKPGDFYHLHGADKSFSTADAQYTDLSQGSLKSTGRELDVAVEGSGFFEIGTPQGVRHSRNGVFHSSSEGILVNDQGYPVLSKASAAGASADPLARSIKLERGPIHITDNGDIFQNGKLVASLQITEFIDGSRLEKEGHNLLRNADQANVIVGDVASKVLQRHVEGSNVNPVAEMTTLLEAQRLFEQNLKVIQQYDGLAGKTANDIAKF